MRTLALIVTALAATGTSWRTSQANGITVRYPPGWHATARQLTPLTSPAQVIAVASYPLPRDNAGANGCQPQEALDKRPPTRVVIFRWEYGPNVFKRASPPRPLHFRLKNYGQYECMGPSYLLR